MIILAMYKYLLQNPFYLWYYGVNDKQQENTK